MPAVTTADNNFTKGLLTEFTALNFPENAATECNNTEFTLIGDVIRRYGIDFESGFVANPVVPDGAITTYKWNNAGGDGETQILVVQIGGVLYFYQINIATETQPLSAQLLLSTIIMSTFTSSGGTFSPQVENQYADGNGYLFVFNPNCDPVYCTYNNGAIAGAIIQVQIRDFYGIPESIAVNNRPTTLSNEHSYNLQNQGWTSGNAWGASSLSQQGIQFGPESWVIQPSISAISNGQLVQIKGTIAGNTNYTLGIGSVSSYNMTSGVITLDIIGFTETLPGATYNNWAFYPVDTGYIGSWFSAEGNYPSNADVWWYFKDDTGTFNPAITQPNVTLSVGNAPQGHYVLPAFAMNRTIASGVSNLTTVSTNMRPSTGAWFQGRVWYTGVADSQQAIGDAPFYTWSENIYFSQVCLQTQTNFGLCYQENDPTSENLFDLLPTDGGVIQIPGSGIVYKLFPIQNGMLVFAANGVWFITGSQGIGFSASDYTITKISAVQAISSYSFTDVLGLPYFWNEEGIYNVSPQQSGILEVNPITVGTIQTFYDDIPKSSKVYARGAYHPINYVIQWVYKTQQEVNISDRYIYDGILNYNTYNKAFFPYTIDITQASINSIQYVQGPGGANSPDSVFKYLSSTPSTITFAEEYDDSFADWASTGTPVDYTSDFTAGYKLHGKGVFKFQIPYVYVYCRNDAYNAFYIQSLWDYATTGDTGRWSVKQFIENNLSGFSSVVRRRRLRGRGLALQLKFTSVSGQPFDIMGWTLFETINPGV